MIDSRKRDIQEKTLKRACGCLGFHLVKHRDYFKIYDDRDREYKRFPSKNSSDGIFGISTVEDFLETEWFEHYHFSPFEPIDDRLNIVENTFFGKSREQLEIELDLLEV